MILRKKSGKQPFLQAPKSVKCLGVTLTKQVKYLYDNKFKTHKKVLKKI